jgi:hypothetical protein
LEYVYTFDRAGALRLRYQLPKSFRLGGTRGFNSAVPIAQSRDAVGKGGTEERGRLLMIRASKERHRSVEVADPDLGGAGIEVEGLCM